MFTVDSGAEQSTTSLIVCRTCGWRSHAGWPEGIGNAARAADRASPACPHCGSRRLLQHPELSTLSIAHIDCDAFYASIEKRDNPDLADKAVIVGGGQRGVVSTCCYIARMSGVRSAMPMFKALKACPDAVVIRPDMAKYRDVGRAIRARMFDLTPLVEPLSIDEAFLDLSGTERLHGKSPAETLVDFATQIDRDFGITVSVGLSHNKFLAKIASDLDKPKGFFVIGRAETVDFLARQNASAIYGIGKKFAKKLGQDGFHTIADLQRADARDLAKRYGETGLRLSRLAFGQDDRPVRVERETKSISNEQTLATDISDRATLRTLLRTLADNVSWRAKQAGYCGYRITLKLKTKDFRTLTRSRTLSRPTNLADRLFRTADPLLSELTTGTAYRLIGIGLADLTEDLLDDEVDLVDEQASKRARAERAMDQLKQKPGMVAVETGLTFQSGAKRTGR